MEEQEIKNEDRNFKENKQGGIDCERFIPSINDYAPYTMTADEAANVPKSKIEMLSKAAKADFEKQRTRDETNQNALSYLASTDWFVARLTETGKPIPADVIEQRAKAREAVEHV